MMETIDVIKSDISANKGNYEVILYLIVFRFSALLKRVLKKNKYGFLLFPIYLLMRLFYKILSTIYLMEIPIGVNIGKGLIIYHLKGTVINSDASIGENVTINHFITIAGDVNIEDGAIINPLSVIVKGNIGKNAIIGAGSVVTKDVAENTIVAGSPARVIGIVS